MTRARAIKVHNDAYHKIIGIGFLEPRARRIKLAKKYIRPLQVGLGILRLFVGSAFIVSF